MKKIEAIKERIEAKKATCVEITSIRYKGVCVYSNGLWTDIKTGEIYTPAELCAHIDWHYNHSDGLGSYFELTEGKAKYRAAINAAKDLLTDWFSYNSWEDFPKLYRTLSTKEKLAVCLVLRYSTIFTDGCVPITLASTTELSALWKKSAKMQKRKVSLHTQVEDNDLTFIVDLFTGKVVRSIEYEILEIEDDDL